MIVTIKKQDEDIILSEKDAKEILGVSTIEEVKEILTNKVVVLTLSGVPITKLGCMW